MGYRTVVMLNNDTSHEWADDPNLGAKIRNAANIGRTSPIQNYGAVVEVVHADTQTLVRLDHYQEFEPLAYATRTFGPSNNDDLIAMLKDAAKKHGYRLVKEKSK